MDWPVPERAGSGQILHILNIHCVPSLMGDNIKYRIVVFSEIFLRTQLICIEHSIQEKLSGKPNFSNTVFNAST